MNILVTGVAGFLGSHLAEQLIKMGHRVIGIDNYIGGYRENVPEEVIMYNIDCANKYVIDIIGDEKIEIIYHLAASAYEGLSVFSPYHVTQQNLMTTIQLLNGASKHGIKRFVFTSSMARYGSNEVPFTEDMTPNPQDPYAVGKLASEMMVKNMAETHGFEYVIAVPHSIIGTRQKYDDPYRNVASIFINQMLQGKQPYIYGDGQQKRCFSYVEDVLQCLVKLGFQDNVVGEIINIGPDEEYITINHLAETISDLIGFDLHPNYIPDRPQEVFQAYCSANKARRLLAYETKWNLREGLKEMIAWIENKGVKSFKYHIKLEFITDYTPDTWRHKLL